MHLTCNFKLQYSIRNWYENKGTKRITETNLFGLGANIGDLRSLAGSTLLVKKISRYYSIVVLKFST
jgi:hypothetical protein